MHAMIECISHHFADDILVEIDLQNIWRKFDFINLSHNFIGYAVSSIEIQNWVAETKRPKSISASSKQLFLINSAVAPNQSIEVLFKSHKQTQCQKFAIKNQSLYRTKCTKAHDL